MPKLLTLLLRSRLLMPHHWQLCSCSGLCMSKILTLHLGCGALQVLYSLASADTALQQRTAAALARLVKDTDLRMVFLERRGLDILADPLREMTGSRESQLEAAGEDAQSSAADDEQPASLSFTGGVYQAISGLWGGL